MCIRDRVYRDQEAFNASCTPGYYNFEGKTSQLVAQNSSYGRGPIRYFKRLKEWRDEGNMVGLEFR